MKSDVMTQKEREFAKRKLSKQIEQVLWKFNIKANTLAEDLGVKANTLSGWRYGKSSPVTKELYLRVSQYLQELLDEPNRQIDLPLIMETHNKKHKVFAHEILDAASQHLIDRAKTYDKPEGERSMEKTIQMFNLLTNNTLTTEQGWLLMACLKMVRAQSGGYRADSYEDGSAYFALAGESAAIDRNKKEKQ